MAKAHAALDAATTNKPPQNTGSSPIRPTNRPLTGAKRTRATANALTTADAAATLTSKLRANTGSAGATTPYPIAIMKAAKTSTRTSRGSRAAVRTQRHCAGRPAMVQ